MFFVKFTRKANGKPIYVNPFLVESFVEHDGYTALDISDGVIAVTEDIEAVHNAIYNTIYNAVDSAATAVASRLSR